jgi:hypothetical protein
MPPGATLWDGLGGRPQRRPLLPNFVLTVQRKMPVPMRYLWKIDLTVSGAPLHFSAQNVLK